MMLTTDLFINLKFLSNLNNQNRKKIQIHYDTSIQQSISHLKITFNMKRNCSGHVKGIKKQAVKINITLFFKYKKPV